MPTIVSASVPTEAQPATGAQPSRPMSPSSEPMESADAMAKRIPSSNHVTRVDVDRSDPVMLTMIAKSTPSAEMAALTASTMRTQLGIDLAGGGAIPHAACGAYAVGGM